MKNRVPTKYLESLGTSRCPFITPSPRVYILTPDNLKMLKYVVPAATQREIKNA